MNKIKIVYKKISKRELSQNILSLPKSLWMLDSKMLTGFFSNSAFTQMFITVDELAVQLKSCSSKKLEKKCISEFMEDGLNTWLPYNYLHLIDKDFIIQLKNTFIHLSEVLSEVDWYKNKNNSELLCSVMEEIIFYFSIQFMEDLTPGAAVFICDLMEYDIKKIKFNQSIEFFQTIMNCVLKDWDFMFLYKQQADGIELNSEIQSNLKFINLSYNSLFEPFYDERRIYI